METDIKTKKDGAFSEDESAIVAGTVGLLYPFIVLFSIYLTMGYSRPGGGFHGGAMFSALFIIRILGLSVKDFNIDRLYAVKKVLIVFLILIPVAGLYEHLIPRDHGWLLLYIEVVQVLIGVNVGIGLTMAVFYFVYYTKEE